MLARSTAAQVAQPVSRPTATAVRLTGAISVNGRLDEAGWAAAIPITKFIQQKPDDGAQPTEQTEVRILYDDDAIYIGARMFDSHGRSGVVTRLSRRDDDPQSDILRIDFDPYHDRLHSVEFDVNPSGWKGDAAEGDRSWDPIWEAASTIDSLGWVAEVRIPFSQLRFSPDSIQTWGLNLTRLTHRNQERALWAYWRQTDQGGPAFYGDLTGLRMRRQPRHVEFFPYVVTRASRLSSGNRLSPFYDPHQTDARIGADAKILLTNSFTLSATVNPDFGQVEVDPAVVNLSAFETFFPEKRPFFVEGRDVFQFGSPGCNINCGPGLSLFYSRRIGRTPQGSGLAFGAGKFADVPENTAILGAVKLTGRTKHGLSVGVTDALSRREEAEVATEDGSRLFVPVEPLTDSFVSRVRQDFRGGNIVVGAIGTSVNRSLSTSGLAALVPRSAQTGGVDASADWGQRAYRFYGAISTSRVAGDSLAVARLQRSSARYFQRPDRTVSDGIFSSTFDPSATTLSGYGAIGRISKSAGNWRWDLNAAALSPGFETNDLGFLQRADYKWVNGTLGRQYTTPNRLYRSLTWLIGGEQYWNYDGDNTGRDVSAYTSFLYPSYWSSTFFVSRNFSSFADRKTRGGPVVRQPGNTNGFISLSTDPRRPLVLSANASGGVDDEDGHNTSLGFSATIKPASNVRVSVGPGYSTGVTTDQYVTSVADSTATSFFGRRYVFAHIRQRQLYLSTRTNVTFTPALSLEVYAQPLLASGDYYDFAEFAAPRKLRKLVYGRDAGTIQTNGSAGSVSYAIDPDGTGPGKAFTLGNPDFNFRSLRGTGVLRWEWRPGSTAYLVWTQTRTGTERVGDLQFSRDSNALFQAPADNIFVLKVSYWLGR